MKGIFSNTEETGRNGERILYLLAGSVLWVVWFPLIVATYIPLVFLRLGVHILARFLRPDLIPVTNAMDSALAAYSSKESPIKNCCQVWKLTGKLEVEKLRKHFYDVFLSNEDLRKKYENLYCFYEKWGFYTFKKKVREINLEERIHETSLLVGDEGDEEKEIQRFAGEWIDTNDYGERPNWEVLLIHLTTKGNGDENSQKTIVLFKIDHGLCDGYTFVHLVEKLSGIKSPYAVQSESTSFWEMMRLTITAPAVLTEVMMKLMITGKLQLEPVRPDARWLLSVTTLELEKVKRIRRATQSHFNTVLGILQVEALRKHLLETKKIASYSQLPKYTWIPSPTGWPNHPAMTQGGMTNHLSLTFPRAPLRENDPVKRLLESEREFLDTKFTGLSEILYFYLVEYFWPFPTVLKEWALVFFEQLRVFSPYNISHCLSPLMLAQERYKLLGVDVDNLYLPTHVPAFLPFIRMYVVPVSNGGKLDLSLSVRNDMISTQEEADRFIKFHMRNALDDILRGCEALNS